MTKARIQPCLKKIGIDLIYYNVERILPRTVGEINVGLYLFNNHFF